jgi:hypothetical protein
MACKGVLFECDDGGETNALATMDRLSVIGVAGASVFTACGAPIILSFDHDQNQNN